MTEDQKKLMAVFEVRLRDLFLLCDERAQKTTELLALLANKEKELEQAFVTIRELSARCDSLLTARVVSADKEEMKQARGRLSKLVREVDKCIALLNE